MRLSGLSSGLDIDQMMKDLMKAERMPVNKLEKKKTELGWKMDQYREMNLKLRALHTSMFDSIMRASSMQRRSVLSSNEAIITATASSNVGNTSFTINEVKQLATSTTAIGGSISKTNGQSDSVTSKTLLKDIATNDMEWIVGKRTREAVQVDENHSIKLKEPLADGVKHILIQGQAYEIVSDQAGELGRNQVAMDDSGRLTFHEDVTLSSQVQVEYIAGVEDEEKAQRFTFNSLSVMANENGDYNTTSFYFSENDSIQSVVTTMNQSKANVTAFFDEHQKTFVLTSKSTGTFNRDEKELTFGGSLFTSTFGLHEVKNGQNAQFTLNGLETERRENIFSVSGMTITLKDTTNQAITLTASTDVDSIYKTITSFVNEYNELIDFMNGKVNERYYRDYDPLTDEERDSLSEAEAKRWDERAQSGLLRNDSLLQTSLNQLRSSLYKPISTGGAFTHLSQIGITTTRDYADGGKLEINEDKLRQAIENDPEAIFTLFNGNQETEGLAQSMRRDLQRSMSSIARRAGGSEGFHEAHQFTIGQQTRTIDQQLSNFERRLEQKEARYWRQFTAMERAMQMANQQSESLFNLLYN
ncbi:flagellar filament capping protein FliD [Shouchella hunanensis]|uniref:Flagellar hook-associated protein 2 n=1 Tax=Shouchella hunanensis TaxID=766894 RepID=A0ABY7W6Z3_9BACI|nr:flagellar filament capping protein FliD [Shouchella hunanensis]WDF04443.1 flagellar filament capping protein FliD [Shouchella hunanensis]